MSVRRQWHLLLRGTAMEHNGIWRPWDSKGSRLPPLVLNTKKLKAEYSCASPVQPCHLGFPEPVCMHRLLRATQVYCARYHTMLHVAGDPGFEEVARGALAALWAMRTELGLLGYSLDVASGRWLDANGGIGASGDSCYEYLLKAYILFGALNWKTNAWRDMVLCTTPGCQLALERWRKDGRRP